MHARAGRDFGADAGAQVTGRYYKEDDLTRSCGLCGGALSPFDLQSTTDSAVPSQRLATAHENARTHSELPFTLLYAQVADKLLPQMLHLRTRRRRPRSSQLPRLARVLWLRFSRSLCSGTLCSLFPVQSPHSTPCRTARLLQCAVLTINAAPSAPAITTLPPYVPPFLPRRTTDPSHRRTAPPYGASTTRLTPSRLTRRSSTPAPTTARPPTTLSTTASSRACTLCASPILAPSTALPSEAPLVRARRALRGGSRRGRRGLEERRRRRGGGARTGGRRRRKRRRTTIGSLRGGRGGRRGARRRVGVGELELREESTAEAGLRRRTGTRSMTLRPREEEGRGRTSTFRGTRRSSLGGVRRRGLGVGEGAGDGMRIGTGTTIEEEGTIRRGRDGIRAGTRGETRGGRIGREEGGGEEEEEEVGGVWRRGWVDRRGSPRQGTRVGTCSGGARTSSTSLSSVATFPSSALSRLPLLRLTAARRFVVICSSASYLPLKEHDSCGWSRKTNQTSGDRNSRMALLAWIRHPLPPLQVFCLRPSLSLVLLLPLVCRSQNVPLFGSEKPGTSGESRRRVAVLVYSRC